MTEDYPKGLVYKINIDNTAIHQYNHFLKSKNILKELPINMDGYLSYDIYDLHENLSFIMKDKQSEIYHKFMIRNKSTFVKSDSKYPDCYPLILNMQ